MTERQPDELWTSYLIRRLEREGITVEVFHWADEGIHDSITILPDTHDGESSLFISRKFSEDKEGCSKTARFSELSDLLEDELWFYPPSKSESYVQFKFHRDGTVEADPKGLFIPFLKYQPGSSYPAQEVIENIVSYVKGIVDESKRLKDIHKRLGISEEELIREVTSSEQIDKSAGTKQDPKLEEILSIVRELKGSVENHRHVLKPDDVYLAELYTKTINEDPNNLQFFEFAGQRIPYVRVQSSDLEGIPGRATGHLYFVAVDKAPEDWQQKIIAYHESLCVKAGHDNAKVREIELARVLGKENEYQTWRESIDNGL